jgi:hypothetical protein
VDNSTATAVTGDRPHTTSSADGSTVSTLTYPISPDYVRSCVLISVCQVGCLVRNLMPVQVCKACRSDWYRPVDLGRPACILFRC